MKLLTIKNLPIALVVTLCAVGVVSVYVVSRIERGDRPAAKADLLVDRPQVRVVRTIPLFKAPAEPQQ